MYLQLWAPGRVGSNFPDPADANIPLEFTELYAQAASNAVHKAGFDGVEIHAANGYLLDQFFHDGTNTRADAYGGSIENRARFPLEVLDAVVKAVGQKNAAFRISPWGTFMVFVDGDPRPTFAHLATQLRDRFPDLAYLHVVRASEGRSNDFLREIWGDRPFISAGGYTRATAIAVAEDKGDLVAFARPYIANPDLPYRLIQDIPLTGLTPKGYTDYAFASPAVKAQA
ncbi:hypothetical protein B0H14DRAFT_2781248 [Mycena olivaceomarginata]|nr:hypothetical protein B0H14DRAFT_2781248 [Mycena olivaceomarginata]